MSRLKSEKQAFDDAVYDLDNMTSGTGAKYLLVYQNAMGQVMVTGSGRVEEMGLAEIAKLYLSQSVSRHLLERE